MLSSATRSCEASVRSNWDFERGFALRFAECVNSPKSLAYALLLKDDPESALNLSVNSRCYQEPKAFAQDYAVVELLRKSLSVPGHTARSREEKARSKFFAAEARNHQTNDRLCGPLPDWFGTFSAHVLSILGPLSSEVLNHISELGKFGPGVNVGVRGDGLVPSIKYDSLPTITQNAAPLLPGLMPAFVREFWGSRSPSLVRGNSHFVVPKNFEIDRCAAKEPLWLSYGQLGIGLYMMMRLKRFGVDLHDQRLNQYLAMFAMEWGLATLDLSSASDLMAYMLIVQALTYNGCEDGKRWLHLLSTFRSPEMRIKGDNGLEWRRLEMFSSMGNGFTFPLETIIFLAVIRTFVPRADWCLTTAYGDDLILPQRCAPSVVDALEFLGFRVNDKKSCLAGTFFESCGTDWFLGTNVRPFYLHQDPDSRIPYALQAMNALRAWCIRVFGYLPERFRSLWKWCRRQVPDSWNYPVPPSVGDVGVHVGLSEALSWQRAPVRAFTTEEYRGWEGWLIQAIAAVPVYRDRHSFGVLCCAIRSAGSSERPTRGLEPVRGLFGRARPSRLIVSWADDFIWV